MRLKAARHKRWTILLVYWLGLMLATHAPPTGMISLPGNWADKVAHILAFTLLGLLTYWTLRASYRLDPTVVAAGLGLYAYATVDEYTQAWVGRTPDLNDWLCNVIGLTAGMTLYLLSKRLERTEQGRAQSSEG